MAKALLCILLIIALLSGLPVFGAVSKVIAQNSTLPIIATNGNSLIGEASAGSTNYGGAQDDWAYSIQQTSDIGLIIAGQTRSLGHGGSDMWLIKTGVTPYYLDGVQKGAFQAEKWNMTLGGASDDGAFSVIQTADGGFAVAGFTSSFGAGKSDMWLVKTDFDGKTQWSKTFGGAGDDCAYCLIQYDGGYLLSGYTTSGVASKSAWIVKTNLDGDEIWSMILPGINANSVVSTQDGYAFAVESQNAFRLITTDKTGQIVIDQSYPAAGQASTQAVVKADDGGYALAGWVRNTAGFDSWLVKTGVSGQKQWSQTYLGIGAYGLLKNSNGGYALTGDRAFLIVTDSSGNILWKEYYDRGSSDSGKYSNRMQSIIEAKPDHYVMAGSTDEGQYGHMEAQWIQVSLKTGDELIPPKITIIQPEGTTYASRNIPLTFYVNEQIMYSTVILNDCSFQIDGNTTLNNLPNGNYNLTVASVDSDLDRGMSKTASFKVDSDEPFETPKVTILSPANKLYENVLVNLNFTVNQQTYKAFYSVDGKENETVIGDFNVISVPLSRGTHTVTVYASCIAGGPTGSDTVTLNIEASSWDQIPTQPSSSPYSRAIALIVQETIQAVKSETFIYNATIIFAVAIGVLIVFLVVITKAGQKQKNHGRLIR